MTDNHNDKIVISAIIKKTLLPTVYNFSIRHFHLRALKNKITTKKMASFL